MKANEDPFRTKRVGQAASQGMRFRVFPGWEPPESPRRRAYSLISAAAGLILANGFIVFLSWEVERTFGISEDLVKSDGIDWLSWGFALFGLLCAVAANYALTRPFAAFVAERRWQALSAQAPVELGPKRVGLDDPVFSGFYSLMMGTGALMCMCIVFESQGPFPFVPFLFGLSFGLMSVITAYPPVRWLASHRNLRVQLTVRVAGNGPTTALALEWQTRGRADRVTDLQIHLEAYAIPLTRILKCPAHHESLVVGAEDANAIIAGRTGFSLPVDASEEGRTEAQGTYWVLRVRAGTTRWPDFDERFPFRLVPAEDPI